MLMQAGGKNSESMLRLLRGETNEATEKKDLAEENIDGISLLAFSGNDSGNDFPSCREKQIIGMGAPSNNW